MFPRLKEIIYPDESIDPDSFFGVSVAIDRRTLVVGTQEDNNGVGSAYVYTYSFDDEVFLDEGILEPSDG